MESRFIIINGEVHPAHQSGIEGAELETAITRIEHLVFASGLKWARVFAGDPDGHHHRTIFAYHAKAPLDKLLQWKDANRDDPVVVKLVEKAIAGDRSAQWKVAIDILESEGATKCSNVHCGSAEGDGCPEYKHRKNCRFWRNNDHVNVV